jgi:hypothetical protein
LKIYNQGQSGNTVGALLGRWDKDCIDLNPNVLNILVGVNDFYFRYWEGWEGSAETYEKEYRELLSKTKEKLPDTKIIIGEPFAVTTDGEKVTDEWFPAFSEYREVAALMAETWLKKTILFILILVTLSSCMEREKDGLDYYSSFGGMAFNPKKSYYVCDLQ